MGYKSYNGRLISILNVSDLSKYLINTENHRTESQFERNRVTKLLIFEFVNNFMSLFYIAFYLQDIPLLQWVGHFHFSSFKRETSSRTLND